MPLQDRPEWPNPMDTSDIVNHSSFFRSKWLAEWESSPELDRHDYWFQAMQLFWAFNVSQWLHPFKSDDNLLRGPEIDRLHISNGFQACDDLTLWDELHEQMDSHDTGSFTLHAQDDWSERCDFFFFKQLWKFLDSVNGQNVSVEDKLKRFFSYIMEGYIMFCGCESCCYQNETWQKTDREHWVKIFNLDHDSVHKSVADMGTWEAENPAFRQTPTYNLKATSYGGCFFGLLGNEIHIFAEIADLTEIAIDVARSALGIETMIVTPGCLKPVTSLNDLEGPSCLICMEDYRLPTSGKEILCQHCPVQARCGHVMCKECFDTWINLLDLDNADACPFCRQRFVLSPPHKVKREKLDVIIDHSRSSGRPDSSTANILSALQTYLTNLPPDLQFQDHANPDLTVDYFNKLLDHLGPSANTVKTWVDLATGSASHEHYQKVCRLGIELLNLSGQRLQAFLDGDTERYRAVLAKLWPIFLGFQYELFLTHIGLTWYESQLI